MRPHPRADTSNHTHADPPPGSVVIGWREHVALPEWGVQRVRAKIDTGARTSAIHVREIQSLENGRLRFEVVIHERPVRESVWVEAEPVRESKVKPSSGVRQHRPVVRTRMRLGDIEREIELSLVCRKGMLCRMLVGRTALAKRYLVDPARTYLTDPPRAPTKKPKQRTQKKGAP